MKKGMMAALGLVLCLGISQAHAQYYDYGSYVEIHGGMWDLGDDEVVSTSWISVYDGSDGTPAAVNFWGNVSADELDVYGSSVVALYDGPVIGILYAADYSTIDVYEALSWCLFADYSSTINVYGGNSHDFISAWLTGTINFYGWDFEITELDTENWMPAPPSIDASVGESFRLRGTLSDGTPLDAMCSVLDVGVIHLLSPEPAVVEVEIDIQPGCSRNAINLRSNGVTPVAILSSEAFDATTVDLETVSLAGAPVAVCGRAGKYMAKRKDVNRDGLLDVVIHVQTGDIDPATFEDGYAVLEGATTDGQAIEGRDQVTIIQWKWPQQCKQLRSCITSRRGGFRPGMWGGWFSAKNGRDGGGPAWRR